jgi:hypothetical protein
LSSIHAYRSDKDTKSQAARGITQGDGQAGGGKLCIKLYNRKLHNGNTANPARKEANQKQTEPNRQQSIIPLFLAQGQESSAGRKAGGDCGCRSRRKRGRGRRRRRRRRRKRKR